jgi:hypothetical protein
VGRYPPDPVAAIFNPARFSCMVELDMGHSIHQTLPGKSVEEFFLDHFICLDHHIVSWMDGCQIMMAAETGQPFQIVALFC